MRRSKRLLTIFAMALLASDAAFAAEPEVKPFQPEGMWIWDNWFVREGARWHAFYLELPKAVGVERRWTGNDFYKHVGHAISGDLVHWHDAGPAVVALSGTWNDRHIATGSVIGHDGKWWMFFTGRGQKGDGVGLALSDDLLRWKPEPEPLFPLIAATAAESSAQTFESTWEGQTVRWAGISDPFIYPEAVDGWFYLVLCARVFGVPIAEGGCLAMMRSHDLRHWEPAGIMAWPHCFERMETPQLWAHDGRFYLSFGGVINMPWAKENQGRLPAAVVGKTSHRNYSYSLTDFLRPVPSGQLHFVDISGPNYIMKVLPNAGHDLAFFTTTEKERGSCLSLPYRVTYPSDGGVEVQPMSLPDSKKAGE